MGQGDEAHSVDGLDEHPRRDAARLKAVVGGPPFSVGTLPFLLPEQDHHPRSLGQVGFDRIGSKRLQHFRSGFRHAFAVRFAFLRFGRFTKFRLQFIAANGHPRPWL